MSLTLNRQAWENLIDEHIEWLMQRPRSPERDHIRECLLWMRKHKALVDSTNKSEGGQ